MKSLRTERLTVRFRPSELETIERVAREMDVEPSRLIRHLCKLGLEQLKAHQDNGQAKLPL